MSLFVHPDPFANNERTVETNDQHGAVMTQPEPRQQEPEVNERAAIKFSQDKQLSKSSSSDELGHVRTTTSDMQSSIIGKARNVRRKFHLGSFHNSGVSRLFNPTYIRMKVHYHDSDSIDQETELMWRARDNRKGRNSIAVPRMPSDDSLDVSFLPSQYTPALTSNIKGVANNLWNMFSTFRYWDMAFWSGWTYTVGSALFLANGVLAWGPIAFGEYFESASAEKHGAPLAFFVGAIFFQIGAVTAYLEAINNGSFHGSAMRKILEGHDQDNKHLLDEKIQHFFSHLNPTHRHREETYSHAVDPEAGWRTKGQRQLRPGSIYPIGKAPAPRRGAVDQGGEEGQQSIYMTWQWWPTWHAIRTHHIYEIGFLACAIQLFGVTLYGVTAIVVLPGILTSLEWWQKLGAFWVLQIVAAFCFLIASLMFMLETQSKWWKPELKVLGWWVGFWATIGSVGFELIAIFGIIGHDHSWGKYQSDLATIWGSAAYTICSFLQWYEALDKTPIEVLFHDVSDTKPSLST